MKTLYKIIITIGIISLTSCTKHKDSTESTNILQIDVPVENLSYAVKVSDFAENLFIPLETTDSILLGKITTIHTTERYIYLTDRTSLYKFQYNGQFVERIKKQGKGPKEYIEISDFQIDENGNAWILSRTSQSLNLYSWNNELIQSFNIGIWADNIHLINNNQMILYTNNERGNGNNHQLHVFNLKTGKEEVQYKEIDLIKSKYLFVKNHNSFRQSPKDSTITFSQIFNDTIYSVTFQSYAPLYLINWGGKNIPKSFYDQAYKDIMDFFTQLHKHENYVYGVNYFVEHENSYWLSFFYQKKCYWGIIPKSEGKALIFNELIIDDIDNKYAIDLVDISCFVQNDGSLVIPLSIFDINEYANALKKEKADIIKHKINYVSEDQNPLLMIIKPKEL